MCQNSYNELYKQWIEQYACDMSETRVKYGQWEKEVKETRQFVNGTEEIKQTKYIKLQNNREKNHE